jgi:RsiW-degrading membrane proteinase PrsW (M82 family)
VLALQLLGMGCGGLLVMALALLVALLVVAELGATTLVAVPMAFLPLLVYLPIVLLIDRFDPEPPWVLVLAFIWGAVISVFGAIIPNTLTAIVAGDVISAVISAPVFEEAMKGLGLVALLLVLRREFDGVVDGIVYASVIALGFAATENVLYYGRAVQDDAMAGGVVLLVVRGIMSPFAHPLFTSMTGIGCGIAREQKRGVLVWLAPPLGYAGAVFLHFLWNTVAVLVGATGSLEFALAAYFLGWMPAFICFLAAIGYCLYRERKIIRTYLAEEVQLGVLSPEEFAIVVSPIRRTGFQLRLLTSGGFQGYRTARAFAKTATRLSLSKWHTLKAAQAAAETRSLSLIPVLRQQLVALRADLGAFE